MCVVFFGVKGWVFLLGGSGVEVGIVFVFCWGTIYKDERLKGLKISVIVLCINRICLWKRCELDYLVMYEDVG